MHLVALLEQPCDQGRSARASCYDFARTGALGLHGPQLSAAPQTQQVPVGLSSCRRLEAWAKPKAPTGEAELCSTSTLAV